MPDQETVYHVISRTVLDGYPLGDEEKDELGVASSRDRFNSRLEAAPTGVFQLLGHIG